MVHNYRCTGIRIQVNNYFNEMSEEHGPARQRAEEELGEGGGGQETRETGGGEGGRETGRRRGQRHEEFCKEVSGRGRGGMQRSKQRTGEQRSLCPTTCLEHFER